MGWPKASMMRPSQAVVGRTLAAWSMMRISAPGDRAERHQQGLGVAEAHHLGRQSRQPTPADLGPRPDRQTRQAAARLDQQARHARHLAGDDQRIDRFDGGDESVQNGPQEQALTRWAIVVNGALTNGDDRAFATRMPASA
jgi:hypothetical protein